MKMSIINVVTVKHDIILGSQIGTIAISVPVSEINPQTNNKKIPSQKRHTNEVIMNHLYCPKETKTIPTNTDTDVNTDKNHQTPNANSQYTDSSQIIRMRRTRKTKKHAIQSAREHQRNQKQMLPDWFIQSNQLSWADFYELTMDENHHISRERLEMTCKRAYDKEQQQRFAECMRSLYYEK